MKAHNKTRTRIARFPQQDPPCLPGFVNPGERPAPSEISDRDLWRGYMLKRTALMIHHQAPAGAVAASWAVRSANSTLRLQNCGRFWFERKSQEGFSWGPARCRSRWCPSCVNLWRGPVIEAFSRAITPEQRVTLVTLTGGRSVWPQDLKERIAGMSRALKRWKRRAKKDGVQGGVYAWEVTEDEDTGKLHAHLHITLVYNPLAWWAVADGKMVDSSAKNGDLTPALAWVALTWASALEREAPALYADLPLWCKMNGEGLLPSMERARAHFFPEYGEIEARRGAVCDIGGRWPKKEAGRILLKRLGSGDNQENIEQTVKYTVKSGKALSSQAWVHILCAFNGRRRIQGFGCLFNVNPEPEESEEAEVDSSELTGQVAVIQTEAPLGGSLGEVLKAFVWTASVSEVETGENKSIAWLRCRLDGDGT